MKVIIFGLRFGRFIIPLVFFNTPECAECEPETADELVDEVEPTLKRLAEERGMPYMRPELSNEGKTLLERCIPMFVHRYFRELRNAKSGGLNFVYI